MFVKIRADNHMVAALAFRKILAIILHYPNPLKCDFNV